MNSPIKETSFEFDSSTNDIQQQKHLFLESSNTKSTKPSSLQDNHISSGMCIVKVEYGKKVGHSIPMTFNNELNFDFLHKHSNLTASVSSSDELRQDVNSFNNIWEVLPRLSTDKKDSSACITESQSLPIQIASRKMPSHRDPKECIPLSRNYSSTVHNHSTANNSSIHLESLIVKNKCNDSTNSTASNKNKGFNLSKFQDALKKVIPNSIKENNRKRHFTDTEQNCLSENSVDTSKRILTESNENCELVNSSQKLAFKSNEISISNFKNCETSSNDCSISPDECELNSRKFDKCKKCILLLDNILEKQSCSKPDDSCFWINNSTFLNPDKDFIKVIPVNETEMPSIKQIEPKSLKVLDSSPSIAINNCHNSAVIKTSPSSEKTKKQILSLLVVNNENNLISKTKDHESEKFGLILSSQSDEIIFSESGKQMEIKEGTISALMTDLHEPALLDFKDFNSDSDDSSLPSINFGTEFSHNALFPSRSSTISPFYSEPSSPHTVYNSPTQSVATQITLDSIILARNTRLGVRKKLQELENELQVIVPAVKELGTRQDILEQLKVEEPEIVDDPPGEEIFDFRYFHQLFNESVLPELVEDQTCKVSEMLQSGNSAKLISILMSGNYAFCYSLPQTPKVISWLFKIMSVHSHLLVTYSSYLALTSMLNQASEESEELHQWIPTVKDITRIFINYGASLNILCPFPHLLPFHEEDLDYKSQLTEVTENPMCEKEHKLQDQINNLVYVLQFIRDIIYKFHCYNKEELIFLFIMLCQVALDVNLPAEVYLEALKGCLQHILNCFVDEEWNDQTLSLSFLLCNLTKHHHNMVYLTKLMPYTERGLQLQKATSFLMVQKLTGVDSKPLMVVLPADVLDFLHSTTLKHYSFYKQHSIIQLIDMCIGNERQTGHKRELQYLIDMLQKISVDIKENVTNMDSTKVKDIIVRIKSKWTLMAQELRQRTIFNYLKTPTKIEILTHYSDDEDIKDDGETEEMQQNKEFDDEND